MEEKTNRDFKLTAKHALHGNWKHAVLAFLIAAILSGDMPTQIVTTYKMYTGSTISATVSSIMVIAGVVLGILCFIIGAVVTVGHANFVLKMLRGEDVRASIVLDDFNHWKQQALAQLMISLKVFLGLILFIIPGLIWSFDYILVPYIMAEYPDITWQEALSRSKEMMYGNRMRYFILDLSFIGWSLLSGLTFGITGFYSGPYFEATVGSFYMELRKDHYDMQ